MEPVTGEEKAGAGMAAAATPGDVIDPGVLRVGAMKEDDCAPTGDAYDGTEFIPASCC